MFWEMLENMVLSFSEPWLVIGDLNCIKRADEKSGGRSSLESVLLIVLGTSWQTLELSTLVLTSHLSLGQIGVQVW